MKRVLLIAIMIVLASVTYAQDTIVFHTGEKVIVQILSETPTGVSYKQWSNLSGPTWKKQKSGISAIKRGPRTAIQSDQTLDFSVKESGKKRRKCLSGEEIVLHIDSIYTSSRNLDNVSKSMQGYMESLPSCIRKQSVQKYYLDRYDASKASGIAEYILQDGETYLLSGGEERFVEVLEDIVMLYSSIQVESFVTWWMDYLENYSKENEDIFAEDIMRLQKESSDILHPYKWSEDIRGKWVLLDKVGNSYDVSDFLIVEVNNVDKPEGGAHLIESTGKVKLQGGHTPLFGNLYTGQINTSQNIFFNEVSRYAIFQFASQQLKDRRWATDLVHTVQDANRKNEVDMRATISASDATIGEKMTADVMVTLSTAALNGLVSRLNVSSTYTRMYSFTVFPNSPNVMNALVSYTSVKVETPNTAGGQPKQYYNDYVTNKKSRLVRWEEEDSVFFVSANEKPITLTPMSIDDPTLDEYRRIKKNHSWKNPAYFLPIIVGEITGIWMVTSASSELSRNNPPLLYYKLVGGVVICIASIVTPIAIMEHKRESSFYELNQKNLAKLRRKASASLTLSPAYCPTKNAMGAAVNLSF